MTLREKLCFLNLLLLLVIKHQLMGSTKKNGFKHIAIKPDREHEKKKSREKDDLEEKMFPNWKSSKPKPLTNSHKIFV